MPSMILRPISTPKRTVYYYIRECQGFDEFPFEIMTQYWVGASKSHSSGEHTAAIAGFVRLCDAERWVSKDLKRYHANSSLRKRPIEVRS